MLQQSYTTTKKNALSKPFRLDKSKDMFLQQNSAQAKIINHHLMKRINEDILKV